VDTEITIREIKETELEVLETMLYLAIYQREGSVPLPFDVIMKPEIHGYIQDFLNQEGDYCLVAERNSTILGAVWVRLFSHEGKSYGYIDPYTPELVISLVKEHRNQGIGTKLMVKMLQLLKEHGYRQVSLSVSKENPAVWVYRKLGFQIHEENEEDYLMIRTLTS